MTTPAAEGPVRFFLAEGPVEESQCLVRYATPEAPEDPKRTMKLRQKLGLPPDPPEVDPNTRAVIDSFIQPREWFDANDVRWVQHASSEPAARADVADTAAKLHAMLQEQGARTTGICPVRSYLNGEAFLEVIRQTVATSWEQGVVLLKVHAERVMAQRAHRELFESRTGYAFRLALKGEKDTTAMVARIEHLKQRKVQLAAQEEELKRLCTDFAAKSEEMMLVDDKRYSDEINALKKEAYQKRTMLENLTAPIKKPT